MTLSSGQELIRANFVAANASAAIDFSMAGLVLKSAASSDTRCRDLSPRHYKAVSEVLNKFDAIRQMKQNDTLWQLLDDDSTDGSTPTQMIAAAARQDDGTTEDSHWDDAWDRLFDERDAIRLVGTRLTVTKADQAHRLAGRLNGLARDLLQAATEADLGRTDESSIA